MGSWFTKVFRASKNKDFSTPETKSIEYANKYKHCGVELLYPDGVVQKPFAEVTLYDVYLVIIKSVPQLRLSSSVLTLLKSIHLPHMHYIIQHELHPLLLPNDNAKFDVFYDLVCKDMFQEQNEGSFFRILYQ